MQQQRTQSQAQSQCDSASKDLGGTGGAASHQVAADEAAQNWPGCFRHVARCRRLNKEEVVLILSNPAKFGLVRTEVLPAEGISSGTVYLCSKVRFALVFFTTKKTILKIHNNSKSFFLYTRNSGKAAPGRGRVCVCMRLASRDSRALPR